MFLRPFVILLASSPAWALSGATQTPPLTAYQARSIIVPFYKALNTGNDAIALINQATSSDWTSCAGNDACKRRDQVGPAIAALQKAIPDLKWEVKEMLVSGDRVIVRGEASGTPTGTFMGLAPGGMSFRVMSVDLHTIRDGKIIRTYHLEDWMGAVRQLSAQ
jgi:predicted ester cyclase